MGEIPIAYLPPKDSLPEIRFLLPELSYPNRMNLSKVLLDENIERGLGNKTAVLCGDRSFSYLQLKELSCRLADGLRSLGVEERDRVMIRTTNIPEFIVAHLAVQRLGAVTAPVMPLYKSQEITHIENSIEPKAMVVTSDLVADVEKARSSFRSLRRIVVIGEPPSYEPYVSYEALIKEGSEDVKPVDVDSEDVALILHTSGTTGKPKGAIHTISGMLAICDMVGKYCLEIREDDVVGGPPTLAFAYGHSGIGIIPLRFGATASLLPRFSPEAMLETIQKHKITILLSVPSGYRKLLDYIRKEGSRYDLSSLRLLVSGGEHLSASLYHELRAQLPNVEVLEQIGTTETFQGFIMNRPGKVKLGSLGLPVPGFEVKVFDDEGKECPVGVPGKLAFKGPVGIRYWRDPERQRLMVKNGWNYSGDTAYMDEDGFFWYLGRGDDMIKSSGYLISPDEVEATLVSHPAVLEVGVVGVPDKVKGERVKAFVVLQDKYEPTDELKEELISFVKERIAPYKVPSELEFVGSIPKSATGKVARKELKRIFVGET